MVACGITFRDTVWADHPIKAEFSPAPFAFSEAHLLDWSVKSAPFSQGLGFPPCPPAVDSERSHLRTRPEHFTGAPSPYSPVIEEESFKDHHSVGVRNRFRTESSVGMPSSPWSPVDGMGSIARGAAGLGADTQKGIAAANVPAGPAAPLMLPPPFSVHQFWGSEDLLTASSPPFAFQYHAALAVGRQPWSAQHGQPESFGLGQHVLPSPLSSIPTPVVNTCAKARSQPRTTVMLRDLPEGFSRGALLDLLDSHGFAGRYDFAYLPVNFETLQGLSHAFVNMVSAADAERLRGQLEGFSCWAIPSDRRCHVVWNDKHQGLTALVERYRNSPVMHESIPEECKPVVLFAGRQLQFPAPTQKIKAPKMGKTKAGGVLAQSSE